MVCTGTLISTILDAFPGESLTQILNVDHNFQEKEHIHENHVIGINALHSKENIAALWVKTMDASSQPVL